MACTFSRLPADVNRISSNALAAGDAQHIVADIMAKQLRNGASFLLSTGLPELARAQIQGAGAKYCIAGQCKVVSQMRADGPALMLQFTVSPGQAKQLYTLDPATQTVATLSPMRDLDASVFSVTLEPHEASKLIQAPSPMYPCINASVIAS